MEIIGKIDRLFADMGRKIIRRILIVVIGVVALAALTNYQVVSFRRSGDDGKRPSMISAEFKRAAEGVEVIVSKGAEKRFTVHALHLRETIQDKSFLEGIEASDFNEDGSMRNSIYSDRAVYDPGRKTLEFDGAVRVLLGEDIELRAEALYYDLDTEIGDIPGTMEFISNNVSGRTRDVRFFRDEDRLELGGEADFSLIRENAGAVGDAIEGAIRASAARGTCLLAENRILFSGGVRIESPDMGVLSADAADIDLNADRSKITRMTASGGAAYEMRSHGETRFISGDRMILEAGMTEALEKALITGHANLFVKSADEEQTLRAREIEMFLDSATGEISEITGTTDVDFRFRRGVEEMLAGGDTINAAFTDAGGRISNMRLSGRSRFAVTGTEKTANELRAETIKANFHPESAGVESITANGGVRWIFVPADADDAARTLLASNVTIHYDGNYPEWVETSGSVTFEETFATARMTRRLETEWMRVDFFPAAGQIKSLTAKDGVHTVYECTASSGNSDIEHSQTYSDSLEAIFTVGVGENTLLRATQRGNFRFISGERSATADRGEYAADGKKLTLTGSPEILDGAGRVNGDLIEYDLNKEELLARGRVRAVLGARQGTEAFGVLFQGGVQAWAQTGGAASPVVVTANELRYLTADERLRFSGDVVALTESQQLEAREINIDSDGNITADGGVFHRIQETDAAATIESGQMKYQRGEGVVRYSDKVEMKSKGLMVSADILNITLDDEDKDIKRVLATGNVFMRHDGRTCHGDMAEWVPASGYVITGSPGRPAIIDDPARGRSIAGRLTYFQGKDRIMLEP